MRKLSTFKYLLGVTVIFITCFAFGQNRSFSFQHFGPEDGLSNANIFAIKQDANHILYLATENGVYNFDGYNFQKIKPKTSLKSNYIRNIGFNLENQLVIINRKEGVYNFNNKTNTATLNEKLKFTNSVDELIFTKNYIYSITDQICVSSLEIKTNKITGDDLFIANKDDRAHCIFKTKSGKVLIGRTNGLYFFNGDKQAKIDINRKCPIYSITENEDGIIYLGTDNAILCLKDDVITKIISVNTQKANSFFSSNNVANVSKLLVDKYNRVWFSNAPDDNLYVIENDITYNVFDILGIDKVLVNCIVKDNDENIWIGTFNDGVYLIQNSLFKNINFTSGRKILPVTCAAFVNENVCVGTINGLFVYDKKTSNTQTIVPPDDIFREEIFDIKTIGETIIYSKTNSISNKTKSVLMNEDYYNFVPVQSRLFEYSEKPNEAYIADGTATLYKIKNYNSGKFVLADTLISYIDYRTKINSLNDRNGNLYIGTSEGLSIYNLKSKNLKQYKKEIFNYNINHIQHYKNRTYLAHDNGITILEDSTIIQQIGEHRLTSVKKIKFYKNKIWVATLDGLFICDEKFNPIVIYNKTNGLQSNTVNDVVFDNDNCCICTNRGTTICNISDLLSNIKIAKKPFISSIEVDEKTAHVINDVLYLNSSESDVVITFISPLFVKPNKQYYKYKFDKSRWLNLENTQVHLTSLEGGKHSLEITCSYDGINWSDPILISIKKDIPFKQTIWFNLSLIFGSLFVLSIFSYFVIKRIKKNATRRVQEDRQVNLLKHQAMNSLMSPHFIFNSLTSIQNYININDSLKASEYLAKFSRLIRMIIEKASQGEILLSEEIVRLSYYLELEKERFKGKFDFQIDVDLELKTDEIKIPNMIIQPYAENSIIHGILPKHEHGTLFIRLKKINKKTLLIIIEDDGIGYKKAKEHAKSDHKSLGTKTIENILELNTKLTGKNQKVEIIDKQDHDETDHGTIITITIQI
jgi:ligand-binding sensor domain-containing protein/two-component sensor histidine kinase